MPATNDYFLVICLIDSVHLLPEKSEKLVTSYNFTGLKVKSLN